MQAMLAENWEPKKGLQYYVAHQDFVVEQKLDGHRVLLRVTEGGVFAYNRNGQPSQHQDLAQAALQGVAPRLRGREVILDSELLDKTFFAFDLPLFEGLIQPGSPHKDRKEALDHLLSLGVLSNNITSVTTARTAEEKRKLILTCRDQGAEGIVFKDTTKPYVAGRNTNMLKVKFTKDIDAVVTKTQVDGKTNASLGVYNEHDELIEVGKASLIGKEEIHSGDVVEVRFLYFSSKGRLVQPRIKHKRLDKSAKDCTLSQLSVTNSKSLVQI